MTSEWGGLSIERDFQKNYLISREASDHPLRLNGISACETRDLRKQGSKTSSRTSSTVSLDPLALDGSDPLSQFARLDSNEIDPLSKIIGEHGQSKRIIRSADITDDASTSNDSWKTKRMAILSKYTTGEKLTIVSSFLRDGEVIKTQTTVSEKVKNRLEQLDDFAGTSVHKMIDLTQQEYQMRIEQLNHELIQAWNSDQRVNALKIAIQCSKLLADTSVLQFYPSQFVLVTDILDNFGQLVYERLRTKAEYFEPGSKIAKPLPVNFSPDIVPDGVKETCLNWFYKIASIRELLPRLYLEMAIIKSYNFLSSTEFDRILCRLARMIRGIGDPLVAAYARCYLCRVGSTVSTNYDFIKDLLTDFLFVYHTILSGPIRSELTFKRIDVVDYLILFSPALDWTLQSLVMRATESDLDEILQKCQEKKNNGLLLQSVLTSFKNTFIAGRATKFVNILSSCSNDGITKSQLFRLLGQSLCKCQPPDDQLLPVLNGTWKTINTMTHVNEFIQCIEPWSEYTSLHFGIKEINTLLGEIVARMNQNRNFEKHYSELRTIFDNIIENVDDYEALLISENFMPFIDLFQKDTVRLDVCKKIMDAYKVKMLSQQSISDDEFECSDAVVTNALMYVCKILNDGITALTVEDERRQVTHLISSFIRSIHFGRNFEQQLSFYVDARATFPNLDGVLVALVHCVNLLAMRTRHIVHGRHTRKTSVFVRSCAAYCFITIPSISSVISRLNLYLLSGQVALLNACLGQADSFYETGIHLIKELPKTCEIEGKPKSTENFLISFIANLLSSLIIVPDSPEQGVLYLIRTLIETTENLSFENDSNCLARIYLLILDMLLVASRDKYPYHIPNIISNDELYGSDPKFLIELHSMCSRIVESMLIQLKQLGDQNNYKAQSSLALDLFERIALNGNLFNEKIFTLCINLWNLAMKNRKLIDSKIPGKILMKIQFNVNKINQQQQQRQAFDQLINKMKLKM